LANANQAVLMPGMLVQRSLCCNLEDPEYSGLQTDKLSTNLKRAIWNYQ